MVLPSCLISREPYRPLSDTPATVTGVMALAVALHASLTIFVPLVWVSLVRTLPATLAVFSVMLTVSATAFGGVTLETITSTTRRAVLTAPAASVIS